MEIPEQELSNDDVADDDLYNYLMNAGNAIKEGDEINETMQVYVTYMVWPFKMMQPALPHTCCSLWKFILIIQNFRKN